MGTCGFCRSGHKFAILLDDGSSPTTHRDPKTINDGIIDEEVSYIVKNEGGKLENSQAYWKPEEEPISKLPPEQSTEVIQSKSIIKVDNENSTMTEKLTLHAKPSTKNMTLESSPEGSMEDHSTVFVKTHRQSCVVSNPESRDTDMGTVKMYEERSSLGSIRSSNMSTYYSWKVSVSSAALPNYSVASQARQSSSPISVSSKQDSLDSREFTVQNKIRQLLESDRKDYSQELSPRESQHDLLPYISMDDGGGDVHKLTSLGSCRSLVANEIESESCPNKRDCYGIMSWDLSWLRGDASNIPTDYLETMHITERLLTITPKLPKFDPNSATKMQILKAKLVDAYIKALPSNRRNITLVTIAVDSIWKEVTLISRGKPILLTDRYLKEIAWLRARNRDVFDHNQISLLTQSTSKATSFLHK